MAEIEVPLKPLSRALRLTLPLAFIAGIVDVVGFVALFGLFTSHFTGNFVVMGEEIVTQSLRLIAQLIALPVFLLVVVASHLVALRFGSHGAAAYRVLLLVQAVLLAACMATGIAASPITDPANPGSILTAQLGVAAMAVQNACTRIFFPGHPSTTVMTINITQAAIDFVDMQRGVPGVSDKARARFEHTAPILLAFILGVVGGAYGYLFLSFWCLALPVAGLLTLAAAKATAPARA